MMLVVDLKIALLRNKREHTEGKEVGEVKMFINMYAPIVAMQ